MFTQKRTHFCTFVNLARGRRWRHKNIVPKHHQADTVVAQVAKLRKKISKEPKFKSPYLSVWRIRFMNVCRPRWLTWKQTIRQKGQPKFFFKCARRDVSDIHRLSPLFPATIFQTIWRALIAMMSVTFPKTNRFFVGFLQNKMEGKSCADINTFGKTWLLYLTCCFF